MSSCAFLPWREKVCRFASYQRSAQGGRPFVMCGSEGARRAVFLCVYRFTLLPISLMVLTIHCR